MLSKSFFFKKINAFFILFVLAGCGSDGQKSRDNASDSPLESWDLVKARTFIDVGIPSEYHKPVKLSIAILGWEDGINISRNGLHIYATYIPADFLSFVLNGDSLDPEQLPKYDRGPHYDMDFISSPSGVNYPWYQSDIIYASRPSRNMPFSQWNTSLMKRGLYSEGGFNAIFSGEDDIDIAVFTSNDEYAAQNNIKMIRSTTANPSGIGQAITITDPTGTHNINTNYIEDNPHIERLDADNLVLFFDSEDRPGGLGSMDIWYSISADNGNSWSTPENVSTINTDKKEHQAHLYFDGSDYWLYYSADHTDLKPAIFRSKRTGNGWNSWGAPEVVLTAGNSQGIGEPTVTANGDLYFVVIYKNEAGSYYNRYDADPWVAEKK